MRRPLRSWLAVLVALAVLATVSGVDQVVLGAPAIPPPPQIVAQIPQELGPPQAPGTSTGEVYGSEYYLAIVAQAGEALVYLCDGDTNGLWFGAKIENNRFDVTTANGIRLAAALDVEGASGTMFVPGIGPLPFETWVAVQGKTGLIRSAGEENGVRYVAGLIFVPGGGLSGLTTQSDGSNTGVRVPRTRDQNTADSAGAGGNSGTIGGSSGGGGATGPVNDSCGFFCLRKTRVAGKGGEATDKNPACVEFVGNGCSASCSQLRGEQKQILATMQLVTDTIIANNNGSGKSTKQTNAEIKNAISGLQSNLSAVGNQIVANGCTGS